MMIPPAVLFSVIVPVYQAQLYLRECLESLLAQSESSWEAICVDDGSWDESAAILEEYAARDARFRVIHQANAGVSAARNAALDVAQGRYIFFLDADDFVLPECFALLAGAQQNHPDHWVMFGVCACYEDAARAPRHQGVYRYARQLEEGAYPLNTSLLINMYAYVWNKLFDHAIIRRHHLRFPVGVSLNEDHYFVLHYALHVRCCYLMPASFYQYRQHEASATGGFDRMDRPAQDYLNHITLYAPLMEQVASLGGLRRLSWSFALLARVFFEYRHILAWMADRHHPRPEVEVQLHAAMADFYRLTPLSARMMLPCLRAYRKWKKLN